MRKDLMRRIAKLKNSEAVMKDNGKGKEMSEQSSYYSLIEKYGGSREGIRKVPRPRSWPAPPPERVRPVQQQSQEE